MVHKRIEVGQRVARQILFSKESHVEFVFFSCLHIKKRFLNFSTLQSCCFSNFTLQFIELLSFFFLADNIAPIVLSFKSPNCMLDSPTSCLKFGSRSLSDANSELTC